MPARDTSTSTPGTPVPLTQQEIEIMAAGGPQARKVAQRLHASAPSKPAGTAKAAAGRKAAPRPVSRAQMAKRKASRDAPARSAEPSGQDSSSVETSKAVPTLSPGG
jgi:hypothetical protein